MRIFITGATGTIGKAIVHALAEHHEIVALAYQKELRGIPNVEWVHGTIARPETYLGALRGCDALIHLAAETSNRSTQLHAINVEATRQLVLSAQQCRVKKKIIFSSAAVTQRILTPYAESKREMEKVLHEMHIPCTILRPTIVYGPGSPYTRGMSRYLQLGIPFVPLSNGGKADLRPVHVEDVSTAIEKIISSSPAREVEIFDLASTQSFTFREALEAIARKRRIAKPFVSIPHAWMASLFHSLHALGFNPPLRLIQTAAQGESYCVHPQRIIEKYRITLRDPRTEFEKCI